MRRLFSNTVQKLRVAVVSDQMRGKLLFQIVNLSIAIASFTMSVVNLFTSEHILAIATVTSCVLMIVNIILLHYGVPGLFVYILFGMETMSLLCLFLISGIPNGFSALWIQLIPCFALFIFGIGRGSRFTLTAFLMMVFLFWTPIGNRCLPEGVYTDEFLLRFPFLYLFLYLIALLIELVRKETQNQLEQTKQKYFHLYRHDALTGLFNRYGAEEYMKKTFNGTSAHRVSAILLDIDNFKEINDKNGHAFGDRILKAVADSIRDMTCSHCQCCRWGGEEFLVITHCDHDPVEMAERIRKAISNISFDNKGNHFSVTVSLGVCTANADVNLKTVRKVLTQADDALYQSKESGKNRVTAVSYRQEKEESPPSENE